MQFICSYPVKVEEEEKEVADKDSRMRSGNYAAEIVNIDLSIVRIWICQSLSSW